jgi:16S rRNA (guanine1516-N2)-methyltransferase
MAHIIANPPYEELGQQLLALSLPKNMSITLSNPHHSIQIDNQHFCLEFNNSSWQKLLKSPHPLLKAIGKPTQVLDACAGLGKDGYILAANGHQVTSSEENLLLYSLLSQAVEQINMPLKWQVLHTKAQELFQNEFETIYLDPMFMTKSKAKPKQSMQIIQLIAQSTPFQDWNMAYDAAKKRLVIKHDHKSPHVSSLPKPSFVVHSAKKSRFDVYIKA